MRISCDDACQSDVRLAQLCSKYEIELIFYWPVEWFALAQANGYKPLNYVDALELARTHEIGSHGITHNRLTRIPEYDAAQEIVGSKFMLERMFKQNITKFAPSRGYTNPQLTELTMKYYQEQRLTVGKHLVHIHPKSGVNNDKPWRQAITEDTTELWCHSWELDRYRLWEELEDFLRERTHS